MARSSMNLFDSRENGKQLLRAQDINEMTLPKTRRVYRAQQQPHIAKRFKPHPESAVADNKSHKKK